MIRRLSHGLLAIAVLGFTGLVNEVAAQITYSGSARFWIHADSTDPMGLRPADWNGRTLTPDMTWDITLADVPYSGDPDPVTFIRGSIRVYDKVLDIVEMGGTARPIIINDNVGIPSDLVDILKFTFFYEYNGHRCVGELRYDVDASTFTFERPTATTKLLPTFGWTRFRKFQYGPRCDGYQIRNYGFINAVETTNQDPVAVAGVDQTVECTGEFTLVNLDGSLSSDPDGDSLQYEWALANDSGAVLDDPTSPTPSGVFPSGPTLLTLTVADGKGGVSMDDVLITVVDTTPPVLVCTTDRIALWPPTHKMEEVIICVNASDACTNPEDITIDCRVSSNEPDDGNGDGSSVGDVSGQDGFVSPVPVELVYDADSNCFFGLVALRAERNGSQSGRSYSIVAKVTDESGNESTASCSVVVPRDRRKK